MSKLNETKLAYDRVKALLDLELLNRRSSAQQVRDCQSAVNVAFYLLGWAQFEYLFKDRGTLDDLNKDYEIRNEAAHNYKKLPAEVRDVSAWLDHLEGLVDKFQS